MMEEYDEISSPLEASGKFDIGRNYEYLINCPIHGIHEHSINVNFESEFKEYSGNYCLLCQLDFFKKSGFGFSTPKKVLELRGSNNED